MAEELCLTQYARDNFGEEYIHHYVNNIADDGNDTYCLDFNTFTESSTFDLSPATPDASIPDHSTSPFVPDLFSSPSPCTEGPAPAMENTGPYGCSASSPDGGPGPEFSGSFSESLQPFDQPLAKPEMDYPMLAAYSGLPQADIQMQDFNLQGRLGASQGQSGNEGNNITLDEMLQQQSAANSCKVTSTSGISSSIAGERRTSFWRGKSPALLMQQLKGPSLSASSSSSEPRTKSPTNHPSFQQLSSSSTLAGPRSPLNLTTLSNRDYQTVGDVKAASLPMQSVISTLSKSAPSFSGQRFLPPLGSDVNTDSNKFKSIVSSGRTDQGQRILRSSSLDPQLIANRGDTEMQVGSISHLKQRREIMPGFPILGEMQRNAASGNNSWPSSSTSPGPSSNIDHNREVAASVQQVNYSAMSVDREVQVGGERVWKKAKGEPESISSEGGAVQTGNVAAAMVEQREKSQLHEKYVALLQTDSSTSKDCKAQILDDTIKYLKELRKRLDVNEADSTHKRTQAASPAISSRKYGDGLPSPIHLEDLELETAGVEISPHLNVDNGPHIEVRMMENQHVMVKLTAMDRPGLFNDIMVVLRSLRLDIQHANIRTANNGQRHDIFAAKMQLPLFSSQSTHSIAMALNQVISGTAAPLASS